jgi:hypothetical protein
MLTEWLDLQGHTASLWHHHGDASSGLNFPKLESSSMKMPNQTSTRGVTKIDPLNIWRESSGVE